MGTCVWEGQAAEVAQVDTITIALTWATADTETVTVGEKSLVLTVGTDATTAQVATAIKEMWNGDTQTGTGDHTFSQTGDNEPEFDQVTASVVGSVVTLTADTAGVPFEVTSTPDTAGDGTATRAASIANASPYDWDDEDNWDGAVPVGADDVIVENSSVDILYNLDQNAVTLTSLTIKSTYTGNIGLPRWNANGYAEYLSDGNSLKIGATTVNIGQGEGTGSGRIKLDGHTVATTVNVYKTGTRAEVGIPCLLWKGVHATSVLNLNGGDTGVAFFGGEVATYLTHTQSGNSTKCVVGGGVTHQAGGTIVHNGGTLEWRPAAITATVTGGTFTLSEDATITTLNARSGTSHYNSSGTCTTLNANGGATVDFRADARSRTVTNANVYKDAVIYDPNATVTWTNGLDLIQCGLPDVTLDLGEHRTWEPSAV